MKRLRQYQVAVDERTERVRVEKRSHPVVTLLGVLCVVSLMVALIAVAIVEAMPEVNVYAALMIAVQLGGVLPVVWASSSGYVDDLFGWGWVREVDERSAAAAVLAVAPTRGADLRSWRRVPIDKVPELEAAIAKGQQNTDDRLTADGARRAAGVAQVLRSKARGR